MHLRAAPPVLDGDYSKPFAETGADELHLHAAPRVAGGGFGNSVNLGFDTSAAANADLTALSSFTAFEIAVRTMPVPPRTGTIFKAFAEP